MPNLKSIFLFLLVALFSIHASAQLYPIQGSAALIPPYSLKLSEYTSSVSDRIVVNVLLNDISRPELRVRFRLRIESQSVKLETKTEYIGAPLSLVGGVPLRLTNVDLAEYFKPNNLNFSGISKSEFLKSGTLPEGLYQFCFDVLEYNRGVKISNTICAPAWLILNDPPLINLPLNGEKLKPLSVQNIVFQWTPRHTGSPNSAFTTEYEFKLVEIWPSNRNPNDAILSQPSIYETVTGSTMLIYGPDATPLELGRHYAFRIRARSITGVDQLDLFKNNGYSEVYSFIYGDACTAPTDIQLTTEGSSRINVSWTENPNHTNYTLRYQLADKNTDWYLSHSLIGNIPINSLAPDTRYQFQVKASCGNYESEFSPVTYITTGPVPHAAYTCGLPVKIDPPDPTHLAESLKVGDIVMAGDFPVKLTKVSGGNGIFTGEGVVEIPFFNKAKAAVKFTDITVNRDLRLVAGEMNVVGAPVEVVPSGVMDFMDDLTEVLDFADSLLDVVEKNLPGYFDESSFVAEREIRIEGSIKQIYKAADGTVVVIDDKGKQTTIPAGTTAAVIDSNGHAYLVDAKGNAHAASVAVAEKAAGREYNLSATFANTRDSKFGFDAKRYDPLTPHYEKIDKDHFVSWKSVETGRTDEVAVQLNGVNDPSKVHFEQGGIPITPDSPDSPDSYRDRDGTLAVRSSSDGVEEGLLAWYTPADSSKKEQVVGKLNVVTYNAIHERVIIVGVNGNKFEDFGTPEQLRDSLNAIYGQAVVHWNVQIPKGIEVDNISPFDNETSGLLSNYTGHMNKVINAYKNEITGNTYYLFLVNNGKVADRLGYMPRSRKFGFIFADKHTNLSSISRGMAHELAHGAYNLHHTFMEPNFTLTKGTTDNLLDYPAGDKLYKFQWDKIRYPDIVMGMFEDDEEARLLLIDFGFLTCGKRALEKASKETGLTMKLLAGTVEGALCATEEDKCDDGDYWTKYSYGLANGIIQQLDVFAIRDVAIDLLKTQLKNKLSCLLNGEKVTVSVTSDLATQNQLRSIFKCQFGIDTSPEEIKALWGKAKAYIEKNYESPYLRGQATALVLTIILPPITKAIQAGKVTQLVNKFKSINGFTAEAANLERLAAAKADEVVNVLDDIAKGGDNLLDAVFSGQKNIINQFKGSISSASSLRKGNFGEMASDVFLTEKGYKPLHTRIQNIDAPTHQGIDGVFQKGNEYFIVEAKYHGTATLNPANPTTGLPKQMTDDWIFGNNRLLDAVGPSVEQQIRATKYRRLLAETAPDGTVIYKELDANATVTSIFNP